MISFRKKLQKMGIKKLGWFSTKLKDAAANNQNFQALGDHQALQCAYIPVFMYLPKIDQDRISFIFDQGLGNLKLNMQELTIFLSQDSALEYCRFMGEQHGIFTVYLPESVIISHDAKLTLNCAAIAQTNIHGCYRSWDKRREYMLNPKFNPL